MVICVTGMHRSGTSAVIRMLQLCGVYLGEPDELYGPAPDNPAGHWENKAIVDIDERILAALGGAWDLPPAAADGWQLSAALEPLRQEAASTLAALGEAGECGFKDPRLSLTLPFWRHLAPELRVVVCVRDPREIAQSLAARGSYSSQLFGQTLWQTYYESILRHTAPNERIVVSYEALARDPGSELGRLVAGLGLSVDGPSLRAAVASFEPALRRSMAPAMADGYASNAVERLYRLLQEEAQTRVRPATSGPAPYAHVRPTPDAETSNAVWHSDNLLEVGGVRFRVTIDPSEYTAWTSTGRDFVLAKHRSMIEALLAAARGRRVKNIVDIGVFKGGSVALYDRFFEPDRLAAIEYHAEPVAALDDYIREHGRADAVRMCYGVNQADQPRLARIADEHFPLNNIDLVVDDASHFYDETKASFNVLFPRIRPGGLYVIEDWAWAHWPRDVWQADGGPWKDKPALSNLAVELLLTCASDSGAVGAMRTSAAMLIIERGGAKLNPADFDISRRFLTRGREFVRQL